MQQSHAGDADRRGGARAVGGRGWFRPIPPELRDRLGRAAVELDRAPVDQNRARAELDDRRQVVRDEHERNAALEQLAHPRDALVLEADVADAEHFVDEQHVGIEVRGDGETRAARSCRTSSA